MQVGATEPFSLFFRFLFHTFQFLFTSEILKFFPIKISVFLSLLTHDIFPDQYISTYIYMSMPEENWILEKWTLEFSFPFSI